MFSAAFSLIFFSWKNIMFKKCVWAPGKQVCLQCFKHFFILMFLCYTDTFPLSKPFDWHQKYLVEKFVDLCVCKRGKRSLEHKERSDREMHNIASSCSTQREVLRSLSSYYHASLFHSLNLNHLFGRNLFTVMISVMIRLHVTFLLWA